MVECSHGKRETLGSSPGRATFFFRPCDTYFKIICAKEVERRDKGSALFHIISMTLGQGQEMTLTLNKYIPSLTLLVVCI